MVMARSWTESDGFDDWSFGVRTTLKLACMLAQDIREVKLRRSGLMGVMRLDTYIAYRCLVLLAWDVALDVGSTAVPSRALPRRIPVPSDGKN